MSTNTVPMVTAVLGYFILKEKMALFEKICLVVSFGGVTMLVVGHTYNEKNVPEEDASTS